MQHLLGLMSVLSVLSGVRSVERRCEPVSVETRLDCSETQTLAIHSATYRAPNDTDGLPCSEDVKLFVNAKCSGQHRCNFRLGEEHGRKRCTGSDVGATLDISFYCAPAQSVARFCNGRLETWGLREGYVASPGYPRFYPRLPNCSWTLTARPGQSIRVTLLDLHLVGNNVCARDSDKLAVTQSSGQLLLEACGVSDSEWTEPGNDLAESVGPRLSLSFITHRIAPRRGFLLHYQVQGCPTLAAPTGGYLVSRNSSAALYLCCRGHTFNDTGQNALMLRCTDGHWDSTFLPTCLPSNSSEAEVLQSRIGDGVVVRISDRNFMADVVVPTILMASLLLGNAVVMAVILRIRKQRKDPS